MSMKEVALEPESQVLTMNKYCVNGFKFQTEEVSRNNKINNSDVYIQGDIDGTGQTIEYYDVIQEIIKVRKYRSYDHFIIAQNVKTSVLRFISIA
ncbi:hypothetical protein RDI58_017511 [Solanum bulbocastanum]|uniref:Uncharacterized protein n=1 Tax=Solanum bulbocastanum TaxID=147425 RepID=A0AAN8TFL4_SOLBU